MKQLSLSYSLPGADWLFSVPSADPLQNPGPLQPAFEAILGNLRGLRLPESLQLHIELPAAELQPGVVAALREGWQRVIESRLNTERQCTAELVFTRRRFLLKGLLILAIALALGRLVADYETGLLRTLAESLIIGGWVAVWVPLERIFYTGFPLRREIAILQKLRDCDLQFKARG